MDFAPDKKQIQIYGGWMNYGLCYSEEEKFYCVHMNYTEKDSFYSFYKMLVSKIDKECLYHIEEKYLNIYLKNIDEEIYDKILNTIDFKEGESKEAMEKFIEFLYEIYKDFECEKPFNFDLFPGPINIRVVFDDIEDAVAYRLSYETSGIETVSNSGFTGTKSNIVNLTASSDYIVRLYAIYQSTTDYVLVETKSTQTKSNLPSNYDISDFSNDGLFDLSSLDASALNSLAGVMNDIFSTGDPLKIYLKSGSKSNVTFINLGDNLDVSDAEAVIFPFDADSGESQSASMLLSDNSTVSVEYDEINNSVMLDGVEYPIGVSLIIDNKKVSVFES